MLLAHQIAWESWEGLVQESERLNANIAPPLKKVCAF